jgi:NADH-quinone oxidoreductase subunit N
MEISIPTLNVLIIAPEVVVLATALLVMIVDLFLPREQKSRLAWPSLVGVLLAAVLSYAIWDGPAGLTVEGGDPILQNMVAADGYALFLNLVILAAAALAILFSAEYANRMDLAQGEYYALLLLSTTGMMLMAASVNLMTIFLALEILSIALYVLVGLNRAELRSAEAALKYFLLGAFASGFLLYGMALIYGQAGTTSLAGLRDYASSLGGQFPPLLMVGLGLMIVGFGFKVALVPFQMWTPDAYEGAPTSVTAFMSVGAKAAGFAALGRVLLYAFGDLSGDWVWVLAVLSALTMTVGNLAALRQANLKRMLAYSSIAHAGYLLVGVAAGNPLGTSGVLFYLFSYAFMNVGAFAVLIAVGRFDHAMEGGETLDDLAGLAARKPGLALVMALFMLSGRCAAAGRLSGQVLCIQRRRPGKPDLAGDIWCRQQRRVGVLLPARDRGHVHAGRQAGRRSPGAAVPCPASGRGGGSAGHCGSGPMASANSGPGASDCCSPAGRLIPAAATV